MSTFSRYRKKRWRNFELHLKNNGGPDRHIKSWKIIDIHEIPKVIGENQRLNSDFGLIQEFDFYVANQKDCYLLRIRKSEETKYLISKPDSHDAIIYLIAEIGFKSITNKFIEEILDAFETKGIPKYRHRKN